mmetsp:Transcript_6441/g.26462  ORF Transcript_6441/g.26462 Transcript_6441/m.26462 type:complete len:358 (-) Transcript_6441:170-1243(-)
MAGGHGVHAGFQQGAEHGVLLGRGHLVQRTENEMHRAAHPGGGRFAAGVAVADLEVVLEQVDGRLPRLQPAHQRHRAAAQPGARAGVARLGAGQRVREGGHHRHRGLGLFAGGGQQRLGHLHRVGGAHHHEGAGARGGFQRDQRAHAVAHQRGLLRARNVQQPVQPGGDGLDTGQRQSGAAAVARQVHGQHAVAMVGAPAGQQGPDAVVVQRAVYEDDAGQGGVEGLAAGVGVGLVAVDDELHAVGSDFAAALRARLRSSIRSAGSSRPMDRRMVPGPMPAWRSAASSMRKWVVLAGWMTSDFASPTLARCENSFSDSMKARPCSRLPFRSKENTAPAPRGSRRWARAWSGWLSSPG